MSIEALRAEFKANLPISLAIKAADSLYFKSNRTYTNIPTEVTHKGGHHKGRGGHRRSSHVPSVREAIDEAKKTLDEVRGGKGGRSKHNSRNRNRRSTSGDNDLKAEVAQLKEENAQIKKDLAELKEIVQKALVSSILVLGDGNLSYSAALASLLPHVRITGSVLEASESEFLSRYPRGRVSLEVLKQYRPRCSVEFGVDATNLPGFAYEFGLIIWNFPHFGGKTNIRRSKLLLGQCFESLAERMAKRSKFQLSLTCLQAGFDIPQGNLFQKDVPLHRKDSWNPLEIAANHGFLLSRAFEFQPVKGYAASGYLNRDQFFHNRNAITLEFVKSEVPRALNEAVLMEKSAKEKQNGMKYSKIHQVFQHDVSILYEKGKIDVDDEEKAIEAFVLSNFGDVIRGFEEKKDLRSVFQGRRNRIYTLFWQAIKFPMSKGLFEIKLTGVCLGSSAAAPAKAPAATPAAAPAKEEKKDEDFDLFGSDDEEEDAEAAKVREERLKAYAAKKATKPGPIAKSSVILDVKPWDDETDLKEMEKLVKSIEQDGLVWGATKLIPIGYGIQKLQIVSTIEDAKVSVDDLIEKIQEDFSDHVQSVDIVAFNKI
uniref:DUF2431 domain-containing protein n=1 Tax=Bursaphelenchus xylophilus TaxID=6326 RepID=A0A1I7RWF9_BURXY